MWCAQDNAFNGNPVMEVDDATAVPALAHVQTHVDMQPTTYTITLSPTAAGVIDCNSEVQFRVMTLLVNTSAPFTNRDDRCGHAHTTAVFLLAAPLHTPSLMF